MVIKKLDLRLLRFVKKMKGQVISTCFVSMVGIILYTALNSTAINMSNTLNSYYEMNNFPDLFISVVRISRNKLDLIKRMEGVEKVEGRVVTEVQMKVKRREPSVKLRFIGVDREKELSRVTIVSGREIKADREVILLNKFAEDKKLDIGANIRVQINKKEYIFKVVGLAEQPEYVYLMKDEQSILPPQGKFGVVFIGEEFLQNALSYRSQYNEVLVTLKNKKDINGIKDRLEDKLDKYGLKRIVEKENQLSNRAISDEIKGLYGTATVVPMMFLIIAAIIISTIISRMVQKDRMTIGILKSLGYSDYEVLLHYIKYAVLIGGFGAVLGSLGGLYLSNVMTKMYAGLFNLPFLITKIYYRYIFGGLIISIIITVIAGIAGAKRTLKIMPSDSMKPEVPRGGKRIFLERAEKIWKNIKFSWKIVIRNIFRNRKRFITVVLGVSITYMVTIFPYYQMNIFSQIFNEHYGKFQTADYNINFTGPLKKSVILDLKNTLKIDDIEGKIEYPFELKNGWKSKNISILGLKSKTQFYNFKNLRGESVDLPEDGILLTENLARKLDLTVGDHLLIKNFIPHRDDLEVEVADIIKQNLGINGYMNIHYMEKHLVDKGMVTGALIHSKDIDRSKIENGKNIASVESTEDLINTSKEFLQITMGSVFLMVIFAGIMGFGIIYNATIISISERTIEFSTLEILGFSKMKIFKIILKETILMAVFGILIGIPLGIKTVELLADALQSDLYTLDPHLPVKVHIITTTTTIFFIALSQLFIIKKINNLDLLEVLKSRDF